MQRTCHITALSLKFASNLRINIIIGLLVMNPLDFQLVEGPPLSIKFQSFVVQHAHSVLEGPVFLDPGTQRLKHILFQVIGLHTALICGSPRSVGHRNHGPSCVLLGRIKTATSTWVEKFVGWSCWFVRKHLGLKRTCHHRQQGSWSAINQRHKIRPTQAKRTWTGNIHASVRW